MRMTDHFEVKVYLVNSNDVLPGIVLLASCEETLGKEESGDPELSGCPIVYPFLHELESRYEVIDPRSQRFQGRIGFLSP